MNFHNSVRCLGYPSKDCQRFVDVDAIVLIPAPSWSKWLSNFEDGVEKPFESSFRTSIDARFCHTQCEKF